MVCFYGIKTIDGAVGGYIGAIFGRSSVFVASQYEIIPSVINWIIFLQINFNLKVNNNQTSSKMVEVGYNPKFNSYLIYYLQDT